MSRARDRANRIRTKIPIADVLYDLGYQIRTDAGDREQQFSCDLHGDGQDAKPSARAYPDSSSWYCFACGKARDAISTYQEKFDLNFHEACLRLEQKHGLPIFKWDPPKEEATFRTPDEETFEDRAARITALLEAQKKDRNLSLPQLLALWEALHMTLWHVRENKWPENRGDETLSRIKEKFLQQLKETQQ
jgi:DNA primase